MIQSIFLKRNITFRPLCDLYIMLRQSDVRRLSENVIQPSNQKAEVVTVHVITMTQTVQFGNGLLTLKLVTQIGTCLTRNSNTVRQNLFMGSHSGIESRNSRINSPTFLVSLRSLTNKWYPVLDENNSPIDFRIVSVVKKKIIW